MKHLTYIYANTYKRVKIFVIICFYVQITTAQIFETNLDSVTCEIVNDTLHIKGGLVQRVELNNLETSKRRTLKEIDFKYYLIPLSNLEKGLYSLKIKGYKKDAPTIFFRNNLNQSPKKVDYIEGYYFQKEQDGLVTTGKADKAKIVQLIELRKVEDITLSGRDNRLYIWKIQNRVRIKVYEN